MRRFGRRVCLKAILVEFLADFSRFFVKETPELFDKITIGDFTLNTKILGPPGPPPPPSIFFVWGGFPVF